MADTSIDTRTARITREQGIVRVTTRLALVQSMHDARADFDAAVGSTEGRERSLRVDIRHGEPRSPGARHHHTGPALTGPGGRRP